MKTSQIRNKLEQLKGQKFQLEADLSAAETLLATNTRSLRQHEQANEIVKQVGLKTQQSLQYHISDITSLALDAIFSDPYELKVEFVERRNKTECDITFVRDGFEENPIDESGVGAVDIASFALRIASWSMIKPRTRNVIILDEPFRYLSEDHQEQASLMLKEISQRLNIQFIIVTHNEMLASFADRMFKVTKSRKTKRSKITVL